MIAEGQASLDVLKLLPRELAWAAALVLFAMTLLAYRFALFWALALVPVVARAVPPPPAWSPLLPWPPGSPPPPSLREAAALPPPEGVEQPEWGCPHLQPHGAPHACATSPPRRHLMLMLPSPAPHPTPPVGLLLAGGA